jgi:hypothetical protein
MAELKAMQAALEALQPLDQDAQQRALDWVGSRLGLEVPPAGNFAERNGNDDRGTEGTPSTSRGRESGEKPSAKDFVNGKRPSTNVERIACLGYYLAKYGESPAFKTKDISDLNTEAAGPRLTHAARDVTEAERSSGYLTSAGSGQKQMSARGEALVEALPDREAVKQALADHPYRRRRSVAKAAAKKATNREVKKATKSTLPKA